MVLVTPAAEDVATAIKDALDDLRIHYYDADEVPGVNGTDGTMPGEWGELGLTRTFGGNDRANGQSATSAHYLTVGIAASSVTNVRQHHKQVSTALEGRMIAVGTTTTTPLRFYSETQVEYIQELRRYWQLVTFSYAI